MKTKSVSWTTKSAKVVAGEGQRCHVDTVGLIGYVKGANMAKKNENKKARSLITMNMLLTCKGGQHRDQKAHRRPTRSARRVVARWNKRIRAWIKPLG
jgi:hypothetical protein